LKLLKNNKTLLSFSGSSILLSLVKLFANILIIRWIAPEELGIWNTIIVVQSYAVVLNLGISNGLNRELPFALGKNYLNIARKLAETGLFISIIAAFVSFFVLAGSIFFVANQSLHQSLIVIAVITGISCVNRYYATTFRTNQAFMIFSRINIILTLIEFISLILPAKLSYEGFLIRVILIAVIKLILYLIYQPFPVRPKYSKFGFIFLTTTGIPLLLSLYITSIADTFKRVILKHFSSFEIVGYFSPALAIHGLNSMLPKYIGQYVFPKLNYNIGKGKNIKALWRDILKYVFLNVLVMIPLIVIGWYSIPYFIEYFFPKYVVGVFAAQIAILSALVMPFKIILNLFNSLKNWKVIYGIAIFKLIVYFCFQWFFTKNMEPLEGMAYGILFSDVFFAIVLFVTGAMLIRFSKDNSSKF